MTLKYVPILCIDPSKSPGYALWLPEKQETVYGSWRIGGSKPERHGVYYLRLEAHVMDLIKEHGLTEDKGLIIAVEAPAPGGKRNHRSLQLSEGWTAVMERFCAANGLAECLTVYIGSWRSHFLGMPKPKALKGDDARAWYKRETLAKCQLYGLDPQDDNAADAIGILKYVKDGGAQQLQKNRDRKRRETQNKRKQAKFDFGAVNA